MIQGQTSETSDEVLLLQSAAGDQAAYGQLFRRHASPVLGFLVNLLRDRELAEEVLQEVFLQVWREASSFDERRASLRSWLFVVARSRAMDVVRSQSARSRREQERATEDARLEESDPGRRLEARATVRSLLPALTEEQRQCVSLSFFQGLSIAQVAETLGIPLGTAKSRYLYGMRKLRAVFEEGAFRDGAALREEDAS